MTCSQCRAPAPDAKPDAILAMCEACAKADREMAERMAEIARKINLKGGMNDVGKS